jgi:nucleotide-binding universal stress UspA family protein
MPQPAASPQLRRHSGVEARLVGTRRRGIGESIREFFTGSVAARLAHRQHRSVLVVPLQEPVPDSQAEIWTE